MEEDGSFATMLVSSPKGDLVRPDDTGAMRVGVIAGTWFIIVRTLEHSAKESPEPGCNLLEDQLAGQCLHVALTL